ncbi:MAG: hypothetical protein WCO09_00540 [bacterium]
MKNKTSKTKIPKVKYVYVKPKNEQEAKEFVERLRRAFNILFTETMRIRNLKKQKDAENKESINS